MPDTTTTTATNETPATPPPQLTLQDIAAALQIIDICSKRGAFEGAELSAIGQVRDKIATFLKAATPPAQAPEAATAAPDTAASGS